LGRVPRNYYYNDEINLNGIVKILSSHYTDENGVELAKFLNQSIFKRDGVVYNAFIDSTTKKNPVMKTQTWSGPSSKKK
jgi:hypothetical protein